MKIAKPILLVAMLSTAAGCPPTPPDEGDDLSETGSGYDPSGSDGLFDSGSGSDPSGDDELLEHGS